MVSSYVQILSSDKLTDDVACIMVLTFVGLMPLGTLILRVLGWTRIHGINQTLASILGITGAGIGIYISTLYNRVSYSPGFSQTVLTLY